MYKIKLREDGWFEAGKDSEGFPRLAYDAKQKLKEELSKIGRVSSREELNNTLGKIDIGHNLNFRRSPYLRGDVVRIDTRGPPGEADLGFVKEV